jgi:hypothetical protein
VNVHTTSAGLDPSTLAPVEDLVLAIDPRHGVDLPAGLLAHDHLDVGDRFRLDALALEALARWRAVNDEPLTFDGVCLPEIWTFKLYEAINRCLVTLLGLRAATERHGPRVLRPMGADPLTELVVLAAARAAAIPIAASPSPARPDPPRWTPRVPAGRRARGALIHAASRWGMPSRLRPGSTLFLSYWPLMPLLDRMLGDAARRPAIALEARPAKLQRSLRAARQGGWLGLASRDAAARAGARIGGVLRSLPEHPSIDVDGIAAGAPLHRAALQAMAGAAESLAAVPLIRRAFAGGRVHGVIGTYDLAPYARLVLSLARDAGVPTFCLAHGAYLLPQPVSDLELADEVALWSPAIAPPISNLERPIHVVGYPLPHRRTAARRFSRRRPPHATLLAQTSTPSTSTVDARVVMRHYVEGLEGIERSLPGATVVLRPHPSQGTPPLASLAARFGQLRLDVDRTSDVRRCLARTDVCVGGVSAATLECALVGTPVVVLNVTGFEWRWPLGGDTDVPVARSSGELSAWLDRWHADGMLAGADDLLDALGARDDDATERVVAALSRAARQGATP